MYIVFYYLQVNKQSTEEEVVVISSTLVDDDFEDDGPDMSHVSVVTVGEDNDNVKDSSIGGEAHWNSEEGSILLILENIPAH